MHVNFAHRKNSEGPLSNNGGLIYRTKNTVTIGNDQDYYEMSGQMRSPLSKPPTLIKANSEHKSDILLRRNTV